jgi:hypothetical protein
MSSDIFKKDSLKESPYPANFIPQGSALVIATEECSPDGDYACTIKGFYKDGGFHIQSIEFQDGDQKRNRLWNTMT